MCKRAMARFERQPTTLMRAMSMASKKRNALKHGTNAKEVMLWSERYEDSIALSRSQSKSGWMKSARTTKRIAT